MTQINRQNYKVFAQLVLKTINIRRGETTLNLSSKVTTRKKPRFVVILNAFDIHLNCSIDEVVRGKKSACKVKIVMRKMM